MDVTWKINQYKSGCWGLVLTLSHGGGTAYTLTCPTAETPEAAFAWYKQVLRYFRRDIGPEHTGILWSPAVLDPTNQWPKSWPAAGMFGDYLVYTMGRVTPDEIRQGGPKHGPLTVTAAEKEVLSRHGMAPVAVDGLRWISPWGVAHLFARSDDTRMWWVNGPDAYVEVPKLTDGLARAGLSETNVDADHWVYEDHARAVDARVRIAQALGLDTTLTDWTAFADAVTQKAATAPAPIEAFDELVALALRQSGYRGCCCTYLCDCQAKDERNKARLQDNATQIRRLLSPGGV